MFSVQVAWSTFTWLGGRSWRLHLHPPSTRLDYSIGAQLVSRGLNLKQIFAGDFFYRLLFFTGDLVGIKSKCCGEGRSAYWICGGGTTSSNLTDTTRIDRKSLQSPDVTINDQMQRNIMDQDDLKYMSQEMTLSLNPSCGHVKAAVSLGGCLF